MSKHIRIIWILSLVSVLLLIGIQGYWLVNQYEYGLSVYSEEIALQALQAGEEEYLDRKSDRPLASTYIMRLNNDSSDYKFRVELNAAITETQLPRNIVSQPDEQMIFRSVRQQTNTSGDRPVIDISPAVDTSLFILSYNTNLTGDELMKAAEKTVTNMTTPFDPAHFKSLLVSVLPGLDFSLTSWKDNDTYDNTERWKRAGNLFRPVLIVSYAFSPLDNLGVYVNIKLPVQPVFTRMGIQLIVSAGITFLLIACLVFQVRTILKQKKVNEIRENFVNTMVHELKRPVQTLKTFVSFLNDKKMRSDVEATEQVVRDSMFELDNLSAYLNKLKDMLQADDETTSLHPVKINLPDLISKVIRLTHIPPDKTVTIRPPDYEPEGLTVEADPIHLANVLSNLIENAIKYSGEKVHIEISAGQNKRNVWVAVKDKGIGIPAAEQAAVFTKFYRGSNIPDKEIPGVGLGLSYVKLIIDAHKGTVTLNSRAGEGTAITISLPG